MSKAATPATSEAAPPPIRPIRRRRTEAERRQELETQLKAIDQRHLARTKGELESLCRSCETIATSSSGKPWAAATAQAANALRQASGTIKLES